MRKFMGTVFIVLIVFFFAGCFMAMRGLVGQLPHEEHPETSAILHLKLDGIIMDGGTFLEDLAEYAHDEHIKGVLVQVNSPGGVVGPSQEIYTELKRVRTELKKPVVVTVSGLDASGAYYAAVAADQIYVNPGSMVGSIGVIMEFANLEKLYDWAKVQRYSITTGAYKDSGAEYRPMREDERNMFQSMANEVLEQFRAAVAEGRKLPMDKVVKYSDGRVMTGQSAVNLGFADKVGTFEDAKRAIGQLAGLGEKPELFEPPEDKGKMLYELLGDVEGSFAGRAIGLELTEVLHGVTRMQLQGQPLFLMPGAFAKSAK